MADQATKRAGAHGSGPGASGAGGRKPNRKRGGRGPPEKPGAGKGPKANKWCEVCESIAHNTNECRLQAGLMALSGLRHNYRNNSTTTTTNTNTGRRNRTSKRRAPVNPERRQRRDQRREQARREQAAEAHQPQAQPQEHGVDEAGARGGDPQTQLDQQMADLEIPAEAGDRQVVVLPPPDRR